MATILGFQGERGHSIPYDNTVDKLSSICFAQDLQSIAPIQNSNLDILSSSIARWNFYDIFVHHIHVRSVLRYI